MRKILFVLIVMTFALSSCTKSLEDRAYERFDITLRNCATDPGSIQITEKKTVFLNDSLCAIYAVVHAKDEYGRFDGRKVEYFYGIIANSKTGIKEAHEYLRILAKNEKTITQKTKEDAYVVLNSDDENKATYEEYCKRFMWVSTWSALSWNGVPVE